jgi:hypothetical protein
MRSFKHRMSGMLLRHKYDIAGAALFRRGGTIAVKVVFCDGVVGANRLSPLPSVIAGPIGRAPAQSACAGVTAGWPALSASNDP